MPPSREIHFTPTTGRTCYGTTTRGSGFFWNKKTAWKFLKYIAAGDGAKEFANYALTAVQAVADEQNLGEDEYDQHIIADLANVKPLPEFTTPKWVDCGEKAYKAGMEQVFLSGMGVQEAMDQAAAEADACLAEN